jgi:hypothetical protein
MMRLCRTRIYINRCSETASQWVEINIKNLTCDTKLRNYEFKGTQSWNSFTTLMGPCQKIVVFFSVKRLRQGF